MKLKFGLLIVLLLVSCKKGGETKVYNFTLPNKICELKRVSEILIKETKDKFISEILFVRVKFGKIFISDRLQHIIVVLNKKGDIEKFIGRRGSGPGEIKEIMDFDIDDNGLIYIFDMGNMRFSVFDTMGNFINSFKLRSNLVGPIRSIRVHDGKICVGIIEPMYFNESEIYKSKLVAVIDTQGNVLKLFGVSDEIFKKFKVYYTHILIAFDKFGNIYTSQVRGTYRIYKYDRNYNLVKVFGTQGKFRPIKEDMPWNLPIPKINELALKFSYAISIHVIDTLVYFQFADLSLEGIKRRNPFYHHYYLKVYDIDGNYIQSDIKLPGEILDIDEEGNIYIYEDNEPGNRRIGIYRLEITTR
ncbi:hypothetical protein JGI24_01611 [Candidatus Kryptobacter tengchongensis]|uniref:6-bladed beta-propeller protein n=1 Tax=Kryptobacter tengchongensis TaxID=1643429 RepID=A0A656DAK2_KRYT1|nr:hypothetical protein JGI24_01611 [Candidatus Kryptobacter tengchongensis]